MKIVARVGSESHTSSRAGCSLKSADGKMLPGKMAPDSEYSGINARYFLVESEVPTGTLIRYAGSGQDGPRGINRYRFDRTYRVGDESTPVLEETPPLGPALGLIKGRLILVQDHAAQTATAAQISTTEGF